MRWLLPCNATEQHAFHTALTRSFTFQLCAMTWGTFLFMASFAVMLVFWAIWFQPETHHVSL